MKRFILSLLLAFVTICAFSTATVIRPGVTLENINNKYFIHFVMPDYEVVTDTFIVEYNDAPLSMTQLSHAEGIEYYFSRIKPIEQDAFDYLSEDGLPELPFYSLRLMLAPNSTYYDVVCADILETETITLPYDYTPSQAGNYFDNGDIHFDPVYYNNYNDTWYWDDYTDTNSYYRQTKGIDFSIFPCHYEPSTRTLKVVKEAKFEIEYNGLDLTFPRLEAMLDEDRSIYFYFDNFIGFPEPYLNINDNYLIITADEWEFDNALLDFKHHKESLGYSVDIVALHETGYTAEDIRDYIKSHYEAYKTKFVLLVGDVQADGDKLPFSDGVEEDDENPPTDIYYSCLSQDYMYDQWSDLNPSVFIGRWPIPDGAYNLLKNIVDKTIASDLHLWEGLHHNENCRIALFSGRDNNNAWQSNYFYKDCKYIHNDIVLGSTYYTGHVIDGRDPSTNFMTMKNYMESNPTWMFVYRGHGSWDWIAHPYEWLWCNIENITTHTLDFQPFGFGFACLLGNIFETQNFARSWITDKEGGVTFLGSTTESYSSCNRYFSRTIFNQLKNKPNMTIGEFVGNGKAKYYNANPVVHRRREAKMYILYGDPSLYLFGLRFNEPYGKPAIHHPINQNEPIDSISSIRIYSVTGQLVRTCYTDQPDLIGLPSGIYTIVFKSNNNTKTQKIILP